MNQTRTARLLLRRMRPSDVTAVVGVHTEPVDAAADVDGPLPEWRARELHTLWVRHWDEHGFGYWLITSSDDGTALGVGGLRRNEFAGRFSLNLYYRLYPAFWGNGFAVEMGQAALAWAGESMPDIPVVVVTRPANKPATRVAERLGFQYVSSTEYDGLPGVVYERVHRTLSGR